MSENPLVEEIAKILKKSPGYSKIVIKDCLEGIYAAAILTNALKNEKKIFAIEWTKEETYRKEEKKAKTYFGLGVKIEEEQSREKIDLEEIQEIAEKINPTNDSTAEITQIYSNTKGHSFIDILEVKDLPLQKALSITTHPFMPEIAENEEAAIALCKQAQIQLRQEHKVKTLLDLTSEEQTRLLKEIEKKQLGKRVIYHKKVNKEKPDHAYLVELCYIKEKRGLAIGVLLNDSAAKKEALQLYLQEQKEFIKTLRQYQKSPKEEAKDAVIIQLTDAKKEQQERLLAYFNEKECYPQKTILILTPTGEGTSRVLYSGNEEMVRQLLEPLKAKKEANAYELTAEQEKEFIKNSKERLAQLILQEKV